MNLSRDLARVLGALPLPDSTRVYPRRTEDCPSLAVFAGGQALSEEVGGHVSGCSYCQHRMAKQWTITAPAPIDIARFLAGNSPYREALDLYLAWPEGEIGRRLLLSPLVNALAEVIRAGTSAAASLEEITATFSDLARVLWFSTPVSTTRRKHRADEKAIAPQIDRRLTKLVNNMAVLTIEPGVGCEATINDGALHVQVSHTGEAVEVHVSGGFEWSESRLLVEAIGGGGARFHAQSVFTDDEGGESVSAKVIVPMGRDQNAITAVVAAID